MSAQHGRAVNLVMQYCRDHVSLLTRERAETYLSRCEYDVIEAIQCVLQALADNHWSRDPTVMGHRAVQKYLREQQAQFENALRASADDGPSTAQASAPAVNDDSREVKWKDTLQELRTTIAAMNASADRDKHAFADLERYWRANETRFREAEARVRASMRSMLEYIDEYSDSMPSGVYLGLMNRTRDAFMEASPRFDADEDDEDDADEDDVVNSLRQDDVQPVEWDRLEAAARAEAMAEAARETAAAARETAAAATIEAMAAEERAAEAAAAETAETAAATHARETARAAAAAAAGEMAAAARAAISAMASGESVAWAAYEDDLRAIILARARARPGGPLIPADH